MTFPIDCHCGQHIDAERRELQCPACGATLIIAGMPPAAQAGLFTCEDDDEAHEVAHPVSHLDAFDPRPRR